MSARAKNPYSPPLLFIIGVVPLACGGDQTGPARDLISGAFAATKAGDISTSFDGFVSSTIGEPPALSGNHIRWCALQFDALRSPEVPSPAWNLVAGLYRPPEDGRLNRPARREHCASLRIGLQGVTVFAADLLHVVGSSWVRKEGDPAVHSQPPNISRG